MRTWSSSARGAGPRVSRRAGSRRSSSSGRTTAGYAVEPSLDPMSATPSNDYAPAMAEEGSFQDAVRSTWDEVAVFWDERVEAGRTWQKHLIQPPVERLLGLESGERVLEIACGNGQFARRMAELGAQVLAVDFSEGMLERARAHGGQVEYRHVDATDEEALLSLGESASFDAVVNNMAIMDMQTIEPMIGA